MTRKDTILIAVVINAGLLAILFTTAVIYDTETENGHTDFSSLPTEQKFLLTDPPPRMVSAPIGETGSNILRNGMPTSQAMILGSDEERSFVEPIAIPLSAEREVQKEAKRPEPMYYVMKSGDSPWKIAKQLGINYEEILRLNQLDEEKARKLKVGDRIRVK